MLHTRIRNNNHTNRLIKWIVIAIDFLVLWVLLYFVVGTISGSEKWSEDKERMFWMMCSVAMLIAEYRFSTLINERMVGASDILRRCTFLVMTQTLLSYLLLRAVRFMARFGWQLFFMGICMLVVLILLRFVERWLLKRLRRLGYNTRTVTLIGSDKELKHLYDKLISNPAYGYKVSGYFGDIEELSHQGSVSDFVSLLDHPDNLELGDEVYLSVSRKERELIERTARLCDHQVSKFYYVPIAEEKLHLQPLLVDDMEVMATYSSPLEEPLNRLLKRLSDIVLSILFLLPTALLLPFIIIAIKRQSPGPIFFRQLRTGIDGREFYCYKFRSMHVNSDADRLQATKDDPRKFFLTRSHSDLLRKTLYQEFFI